MSKRLIGKLDKNEEIVIEKGYVYAKEKFEKFRWAANILNYWDTSCVDYYICTKAKTVVAFQQKGNWANRKPGVAICHPDDKFDVTIGKAIALCRLKGLQIPKEIFE